MKISQMLEREDFYSINEKTLAAYYGKGDVKSTLYVYPQLNAIVTSTPSKSVKKYLLCEYSVRSGFVKRMLVEGYVRLCLNSFGALSSAKTAVESNVSNDTLIYPCNKKYRIFDFDKNTVDVIIKDGFDNSDLKHEIEFRQKKDLPDFVPALTKVLDQGYSEKIIDGVPLARIADGFEKYRDDAYKLLAEYSKSTQRTVKAKEYADLLYSEICKRVTSKVKDAELLKKIASAFVKKADATDVTLCFSHGDFQAGNIWVEKHTSKIYIIDWESWGERSIWYDKAVLYDGLRPGGIDKYLIKDIPEVERAIVLLEDMIFCLNELNNLPHDFGIDQFEEYLKKLKEYSNITKS